MAPPQSPPQPPSAAWYPAPSPRRYPDAAVVGILVAVVLIVVFGIGAAFFVGLPGAAFMGVFCIPVLFVVLIVVLALASGFRRRTIPPPPPIQQPMVPAGQQGPIALNCPNCGGPPTNVDRFGIATCSYCGTRFLVR